MGAGWAIIRPLVFTQLPYTIAAEEALSDG